MNAASAETENRTKLITGTKKASPTKSKASRKRSVSASLPGEEAQGGVEAAPQMSEEEERLIELRKQGEREKAWFMAHAHKFVKPIDDENKPIFCPICLQRAHEYWTKCFEEVEHQWRLDWHEHAAEFLGEKQQVIKNEIESTMRMILEARAAEIVARAMEAEQQQQQQEDHGTVSLSDAKGSENPQKNKSRGSDDDNRSASADSFTFLVNKKKDFLSILGLPEIDANGLSVLPQRSVLIIQNNDESASGGAAANLDGPSTEKKEVSLDEGGGAEEEHLEQGVIDDIRDAEVFGLQVRVFHRNSNREREKFLGMVQLSEKVFFQEPFYFTSSYAIYTYTYIGYDEASERCSKLSPRTRCADHRP